MTCRSVSCACVLHFIVNECVICRYFHPSVYEQHIFNRSPVCPQGSFIMLANISIFYFFDFFRAHIPLPRTHFAPQLKETSIHSSILRPCDASTTWKLPRTSLIEKTSPVEMRCGVKVNYHGAGDLILARRKWPMLTQALILWVQFLS